jgi:hypothetical protein
MFYTIVSYFFCFIIHYIYNIVLHSKAHYNLAISFHKHNQELEMIIFFIFLKGNKKIKNLIFN